MLLSASDNAVFLEAVDCVVQIGMEMWARYAHKALWHDFEPGWRLHKSHHVPRLGPFEDNDVFAIINAVPAMGLCAYGFITPNVVGGMPSRLLSDLCCCCSIAMPSATGASDRATVCRTFNQQQY